MKCFLLFVFLALCNTPLRAGEPVPASPSAAVAKDSVTIAPAPAGEQLSDDFDVSVAGRAASVYRCRVSAVPLNQVWPGYQRPLDQTELAGFAYWDMAGPAPVEIRCRRAPKSVAV